MDRCTRPIEAALLVEIAKRAQARDVRDVGRKTGPEKPDQKPDRPELILFRDPEKGSELTDTIIGNLAASRVAGRSWESVGKCPRAMRTSLRSCRRSPTPPYRSAAVRAGWLDWAPSPVRLEKARWPGSRWVVEVCGGAKTHLGAPVSRAILG